MADPAAFAAAVALARPAAEAGQLVTFGVVPTQPETGYGYLRIDPRGAPAGQNGVWPVQEFVEKPDFTTAQRYVHSGVYLWNSGMFLFLPIPIFGNWLCMPRILAWQRPESLAASLGEKTDLQESVWSLDKESFSQCRKESIDYAVMEKTRHASVVPLAAGWSDVGSFASLFSLSEPDAHGNVLSGDVIALDCTNSYVRAESRLVAVTGLDDCVVVETADAVLVVPKARAQEVKNIVAELQSLDRPEARLGRQVFRPWGSYQSLDDGNGFQVKRLTVFPGGVLSLQLHHHRAEHWVVISGRARITRNDDVFELCVGEHTFIPQGTKHRIENPDTDMLRIIEVQVGSYLGEDDIVRFADVYGRQGRTD